MEWFPDSLQFVLPNFLRSTRDLPSLRVCVFYSMSPFSSPPRPPTQRDAPLSSHVIFFDRVEVVLWTNFDSAPHGPWMSDDKSQHHRDLTSSECALKLGCLKCVCSQVQLFQSPFVQSVVLRSPSPKKPTVAGRRLSQDTS